MDPQDSVDALVDSTLWREREPLASGNGRPPRGPRPPATGAADDFDREKIIAELTALANAIEDIAARVDVIRLRLGA